MDFDFSRLRAVLISHDHSDHSKYINDFVKRTNAVIYATKGTYDALKMNTEVYRYNVVRSKETINVSARITIMPFDVTHDAPEPVGFLIDFPSGERMIYVTDTKFVKYRFNRVTHMLVEMNYDVDIAADNVRNNSLNVGLERRILRTHFEKKKSLEFIRANKSSSLQEVWLIHISKGNGDPRKFKEAVQALTGVPVFIASEQIIN